MPIGPRVGSLCSGVGSLDASVPGTLSWVAETGASPSAILAAEHPDVPNIGDITAVDWSTVAPIDLLTSGDPCQSMSDAGLRQASNDERFLWPYVIDAVRALHPSEVFLENVRGLTSRRLLPGAKDWRGRKGSVLKQRLDDLRAAGYEVRWALVGACAVGAPHHRHRWFLRARYVGAKAAPATRVDVMCGAPLGGRRVLLPTPRARDHKGGSLTVRPIDGGPDLPTAIALLPTPTAADGAGGPGKSLNGHDGYNLRTAVTLLPSAPDLVQDWQQYTYAIRTWERIMGRPAPLPTYIGPRGGRRLAPALSEWMMGLPEGYLTDRLPSARALQCAGNGAVTLQAAAAFDLLAPANGQLTLF